MVALDGEATDPEGRSQSEFSDSSEGTCSSYETCDSRSAACTSGDEGDSVSEVSLGGLSVRAYYSQE